MDYEKKYKEALERAKSFAKRWGGIQATDSELALKEVKAIFPELKESEDEKIIYDAIKEVCNVEDARAFAKHNETVFNVAKRVLEKQGDHDNFRNKIQIGDKVTRNKDGVIVNLSQLSRVAKKDEKQGKQKPVKPQQDMLSQEKYAKAVDECIYGEQEPTDKVEPKFKKGDWVRAISSGNIFKILSVNHGLYRVLCYDGVEANYPIIDVEKDLAYWTIQDAKDGDVLCCNQIILLFKQWEDNSDYNFVIAYAGIDISGKLQITDGHWLISNESKPATKEQRDTLERAMTNAGYTFDFEKKELKKIEQKSSWSEEDKKMSRFIGNAITADDSSIYLGSKGIQVIDAHAWLEELKERVLPQPKQELSEEDETVLNNLIYALTNDRIGNNRDEYVDWLKSLRPQKLSNMERNGKNWKPSEEQLRELHCVISGCSFETPILVELEEQLKKL